MTTIEVAVQGIIMFVSMSVYGGTNTNMGAAIAIHHATPNHTGTYGIMLPVHEPRLRFAKTSVDGNCTGVFVPNGQVCEVALTGHLIELGTYSNTCMPLPDKAGATGPLEEVPDLSKLVPKTKLLSTARPNGNNYSAIDKDLVAGWLRIPDGEIVSDKHTRPGVAEFRPSPNLERYRPTLEARWSIDVDAPCLIVTPFGGSAESIRFKTAMPVSIFYVNLPEIASGHAHGRKGVSYDFEIFYKILEEKPGIPPVPYYLREILDAPGEDARLVDWVSECALGCIPKQSTDPQSGENCGPGKNSKP